MSCNIKYESKTHCIHYSIRVFITYFIFCEHLDGAVTVTFTAGTFIYKTVQQKVNKA